MPVGAGFIPARIGENKKMTEHKKLQPEIRFAGFTDDWEQRKLGEVVERITRKNLNLESRLPLTISAQDGLISQTEFFDKQVASKNISGYYLIENGEFAYNKSYSNGYPWGAIKRLDKYKNGVLSTLYIVFNPIDVDSQFLVSYFDTTFWHSEIAEIAVEGARNHGLLNIPVMDFFRIKIKIPKSKEEQTQIGNFFKQLDDTIALHQRTLEKYQKLKVSYLEKMFPKGNERYPELRFPNSTDAWEQRKLGEVVEFFSGLTYSPTDVLNNGTLVLRSSNIQDSQIVTDDNVYVRPECVYSQNVEIGDIVVVVRNGSKNLIGKHALVSKQMNNTVIGAFMTGIRSNNPSFFNALLDTSKFNDEIEKNLGATINQITTGAFKSMEFLIPSYEEQTQIGNFFKQLDDTIALHQREVEKYKKIKQSYLEKMFI